MIKKFHILFYIRSCYVYVCTYILIKHLGYILIVLHLNIIVVQCMYASFMLHVCTYVNINYMIIHRVYCLLFLGTFICSITSPELIANTLIISCELLETLRRISATITCTNCTYFQPITIIGDSPIVVSDLIAGQYTIEMAIADSTEVNDTIAEIISVSDNKLINSTVVKMITESNKCTSVSTNGPISESMYVCTYIIMFHVAFYVYVHSYVCTLTYVHYISMYTHANIVHAA